MRLKFSLGIEGNIRIGVHTWRKLNTLAKNDGKAAAKIYAHILICNCERHLIHPTTSNPTTSNHQAQPDYHDFTI